jgi:hypothetical protein
MDQSPLDAAHRSGEHARNGGRGVRPVSCVLKCSIPTVRNAFYFDRRLEDPAPILEQILARFFPNLDSGLNKALDSSGTGPMNVDTTVIAGLRFRVRF